MKAEATEVEAEAEEVEARVCLPLACMKGKRRQRRQRRVEETNKENKDKKRKKTTPKNQNKIKSMSSKTRSS